jgi:hypothetical protein
MKIFLLLFSVLFLASCSPKTNQVPSIGNNFATRLELIEILNELKMEGHDEIYDDNYYCITTKEWVEYFIIAWKKELWDRKLTQYALESNDCDKFSNRARMFAQELNHKTDNRNKAGLAVGKVNYRTKSDSLHAIIVFIINNNGKKEAIFVEPDMYNPNYNGGIKELTKVEIFNITSLEF